MHTTFKASKREDQGTGASRRLRRAGKLPGIIYGNNQAAIAITLDHNELFHLMRKETFHASVLAIDVEGGSKETVILRDAQWHPYKQLVLHIDFQRINVKEKMRIKVPLHFINAEICPAVKLDACMVNHVITEIEIECLPGNLPEFIEVDLKDLTSDQSVHVSQLVLPKGVEILPHGDADPVIATVLKTGGGEEESGTDENAPAAEG